MNWRAILDAIFPAQCAYCNVPGEGLCEACFPPQPPLRACVRGIPITACGWYEGALRAAVLAVKDGRRDVAEALGARVAPLVPAGAVLVPIPTTAARRRVRGIDGVALMAEIAAAASGALAVNALRHRARDAQRGRNRAARLAARGRFASAQAFDGCAVTLVDDVCTTGATLEDCAAALSAAGARIVGATVVAVTKAEPSWKPHPD